MEQTVEDEDDEEDRAAKKELPEDDKVLSETQEWQEKDMKPSERRIEDGRPAEEKLI